MHHSILCYKICRVAPGRSRQAKLCAGFQSLSTAQGYLLMKSLPSAEMLGLAGNVTVLAFSITSSRRIFSWLQPSPNGLLPKSIWYSITPADHTSTCSNNQQLAFQRRFDVVVFEPRPTWSCRLTPPISSLWDWYSINSAGSCLH